jgi:hypothetical protein
MQIDYHILGSAWITLPPKAERWDAIITSQPWKQGGLLRPLNKVTDSSFDAHADEYHETS